MQAPPANLGPHTIPQSNPGNVMQAMQKLQQAAQLITQAIPEVPMGTPLHTKILKIATDLNKELGDAKENMQQQIQTLLQAVQAAKQNGQNGMLNRAAPPPPNSPPAMTPPPPGAGGPPGM
jgi:hypothetical protein